MLPWEFYLQDTIPYTLVCNVTLDPNTRFFFSLREKKKEKSTAKKKKKKNLAEQAACFRTQRIVGIVVLGVGENESFSFLPSLTVEQQWSAPNLVHQVLRVHWLSQNALSLPSSSAAMFM